MRRSTFARLPVALLLLAGISLTLAAQTLRPTPASANTLTTSTVCGVVTGYLAATPVSGGYIVLGGVSYPIEPGGVITGTPYISSGITVCLQAFFDPTGAIASATITLGGVSNVSVCGTVTVYVAAGFGIPGYMILNGVNYPIAPGGILYGAGFLSGNTVVVCISGNLNSLGQLIAVTVTSNGVVGPFRACGNVTVYIPPTGLLPGSIYIGGRYYGIAAGSFLVGGLSVLNGADVCLSGTLDALGNIVTATVSPDVPVNIVLCGAVLGYTPATPNTPGNVTIGTQTYVIEAGTILANDILTVPGNSPCLNATLDAVGRISGGSFSLQGGAIPPSTTTSACGTVGIYSPATAYAAGSLTVGGVTYAIAPGVTLTGAGIIGAGAAICVQLTVNSSGQVTSGSATTNGTVQVKVCGLASSVTPATPAVAGLLTIAGITFPLAPGTTFSGGTLTVPSTLGITLSINGQGQVVSGSITSTSCSGQSISGPITSYVPATATTVGSLTIGGSTFLVAAGTTLTIGSGIPLSARLYAPPAPRAGRTLPV